MTADPRLSADDSSSSARVPADSSNASADAARPAIAEARVVKRERWSLVWLVPLVAVAIGIWLAYHTISQRGPTITIEFPSADGIQAGKTKVRFKDVVIGQVTGITLSNNLQKVLVKAELTRDAERYLTEKTRFWVARPRITASQVSGLETLLSGAYVAIDPVLDGKSTRHFVGLKDPPVITTSEPGSEFSLRAPTLGSLNLGSPVYYRHIQVGQVVNYHLDQDGGAVTIDIFIAQPHDRLVFGTTRFWNASGFDLRVSAEGVTVDTESLVSLLIGGIAFDTPDTLDEKGAPASRGQYFPLYASRAQAHERIYLTKERFVMLFDGSVRGLSTDAPVMLRGITIGKVLDVQLEFDTERLDFQIPVLVEIEPERIVLTGADHSVLNGDQAAEFLADGKDILSVLVANGLRAQLKTGSLLTGQLYVEVDLHPDAPAATVGERDGYRVLPTLPTPLEAVTTKVNRILSDVEAIPFKRIGTDLSATLDEVRALVGSPEIKHAVAELDLVLQHLVQLTRQFDQEFAPELLDLLGQGQRMLDNVNAMLAPDAPISVEALRTLREFQSASRSVRVLADYLERHPEALLKGKGGMQ